MPSGQTNPSNPKDPIATTQFQIETTNINTYYSTVK